MISQAKARRFARMCKRLLWRCSGAVLLSLCILQIPLTIVGDLRAGDDARLPKARITGVRPFHRDDSPQGPIDSVPATISPPVISSQAITARITGVRPWTPPQASADADRVGSTQHHRALLASELTGNSIPQGNIVNRMPKPAPQHQVGVAQNIDQSHGAPGVRLDMGNGSIAGLNNAARSSVSNGGEALSIPQASESTLTKLQKETVGNGELPKVPTILSNSARENISLNEAIQRSLHSKRIFHTFGGNVQIEEISPFDPAIAQTEVQNQLSKFDTNLAASGDFARINQPPNSFFGPGLAQPNRFDEGNLKLGLEKIFANGINGGIGYEPSLAYLFFPDGGGSGFNPAHSAALVTRVNIPLLRGAGEEANLGPARAAEHLSNKSILEVKATLQAQLRSIEQAYWLLHANHVKLLAVTDAIESSQRILQVTLERFNVERSLFSDVARARVQLENLYQQKLDTEADVRKTSFDLAQLIGIPDTENLILVPVDRPEFRSLAQERDQIVQRALVSSPILQASQEEIASLIHTYVALENQLLPQMDLLLLHRTSGVDNDLGNAMGQMFSYEFSDLQFGVEISRTVQNRKALAEASAINLAIAKQRAVQDGIRQQISFDIQKSLTTADAKYLQCVSSLAQLEHAGKWVEIAKLRYQDPPLNLSTSEAILVLLVDYQTAIQAKIDAIEQIADALAEYNSELASIDEKQGILLDKWQIEAVVQ